MKTRLRRMVPFALVVGCFFVTGLVSVALAGPGAGGTGPGGGCAAATFSSPGCVTLAQIPGSDGGGATFGGPLEVTDTGATCVTVDTNVLRVDCANNRVGVNTTSPTVALDVTGALLVSSYAQAPSLLATNLDAGTITISGTGTGSAAPVCIATGGSINFTSCNGSGAQIRATGLNSMDFCLNGSCPYNYTASLATVPAVTTAGSYTSALASGDAVVAVSGAYTRIKFGAAAPTATDCDAAGEAGRLYVDTSASARWCVCDGVEWNCVAVAP